MAQTEFAVTFEDLSLTFFRHGENRRTLGPMTGCVKSGQIFCVVGPHQQCCDFLDAVSGNFPLLSSAGFAQEGKFVSGTITWNGQLPNIVDPRVIARVDKLFDLSMAGHLTTWEILLLTVKVRVPNLTAVEQASMVDMILDMMSLQEFSSIPASRLDSFSLVLLNIGREVIGCSGILFLLDPLTGLSPMETERIFSRLKILAEKHSYCITVTLSEPTSGILGHLNDISVINSDGAVLFHGPAAFARHVFAFHGLDCPEDFNFLDFLLHHVCFLSDVTADAMVVFSADSDFSQASRRAAADVRSQRVHLPSLIERGRNLDQRFGNDDLRWFASMLRTEWSLVYNDPIATSKFLLFPLVLGTMIGCVFFGLPRDSVGAQERAGFFALLLWLFSIDAVNECTAIRKRVLWNDCCSHRLNIVALTASCLFGELIVRRGIPVVVMLTGAYVFMGLAEDLFLYLEFLGLGVLGSWLIFLVCFSFDLATFSCQGQVRLEDASRVVAAPGGAARTSQQKTGRSALVSSLGIGGGLVLGLGLLTMGFPLSARVVPAPLAWLGSCLPFQPVYSAMMVNQVGSFADGEALLKKNGFLFQGSLLVSTVISLSYLVVAIYIFLLRHPEPESGPHIRLQGHTLDGCLQSLENGLHYLHQLGSKLAGAESGGTGEPKGSGTV